MNKSLHGKVAIITGANQGLGEEIASRYVAEGASVVLCARNLERLQAVQHKLKKMAEPKQLIEIVEANVADENSAKEVVVKAIQLTGKVDILVNNAGVLGPIGPIEEVDLAELVNVLQVNLLGSILMVRAVLPFMKKQKKGKIIQLSGGGATAPRPYFSGYAISKAGIIRFIETLAKEVEGFNIDVNSIAPGSLNTKMLDQVLEAGPEKIGESIYSSYIKQKETGGTSLDLAANLAVFLASAESDGITGRLISAVWDLWEQWPHYRDDLANSDVYTLRRITGRDRGFHWGDK